MLPRVVPLRPFHVLLGLLALLPVGWLLASWLDLSLGFLFTPWLAVTSLVMAWLLRPRDDATLTDEPPPAPRPRPKGDIGLRAVPRLTGADPLDGLLGASSSFPVVPDDLGEGSEHHLVLRDDDDRS